MVGARREIRTRLPADVAWERVCELVGPGHWGAARRTFAAVHGDGEAGSLLRSSTYVDDETVVTDVDVVRHERNGDVGLLVLHGAHDLGSATEVLSMAPEADELVVTLELAYAVGVDLGPMRLWVGQFADDLAAGLTRVLEAADRPPNTM